MVTDAAGQVATVLPVPHCARQGTTGGRTMPLHPDLHAAFVMWQTARADITPPAAAPLLGSAGSV
jgi:hypothetical protein